MDQTRPTTKKCPDCGAENSESATFCTLCLTRFGEPLQQAQEAQPAEQTVRSTEEAEGDAQAGGEAAAVASEPGEPAAETCEPGAARGSAETEVAPARPGHDWGDVDAFEDLPPELQLQLQKPREDLDMRRIWMRAGVAIAVSLIALALSVGVLVLIANQRMRAASDVQMPQQVQPAPAPSVQPAPGPTTPETHPDLAFAAPSSWTVSGAFNDIVLRSADGSVTVEIRSWQRAASGRYQFVSGELQAVTQSAAVAEVAPQLLSFLYGPSVPTTATTSSQSVSGAQGVSASFRDEANNSYREAYAFVRGDWTYLVVGSGVVEAEDKVSSGVRQIIRFISFKS